MEKTVKVLMLSYYEEVDSPYEVGKRILAERIAHLGETVDITRELELNRLEALGAFYTDEELKQIEDGTYRGVDAAAVRQRLSEARVVQPLEDEGSGGTLSPEDVAGMSDEEIARHIIDNKLGVAETVALGGDDAESIEKVLDAESLVANENQADPRKGVIGGLEARLAKATSGANA